MSLPTDIIYILIVIFVFSIVAFLGHTILLEYKASVETMDIMPDVALNATNRALDAFAVFDYMFIFVVVGLMIAAIIMTFIIPTHPIFLIIAIISFIVVLIIGPQLANVFLEFAESESINATTVATYPSMISIWTIMPMIILLFGAIFVIATYAKIRSPREGA